MASTRNILDRLGKFISIEGENDFMSKILAAPQMADNYDILKEFLYNITQEIDALASEIKNDDNVLVSVKDQKLLRTCFQLVVSFGVSSCLIPGLGVSLSKKCTSAQYVSKITLTDEQKYDILTLCTDFLYRSYNVPVFKNIIITFHLSDYLAALIQLAFAPLKKPGQYPNFTMTKDLYERLTIERQKYTHMYEYLVNNCFQPMLMKELLVLQNVTDQTPPIFVKKVISKEMSQRLISPGGLLSLIRCFLDSYDIDVGLDWKKIDMVSRIVTSKHGNLSESDYINNITSQLKQILGLNNAKYLAMATYCLVNIYEKYVHHDCVKNLVSDMLQPFNVSLLTNTMPGTIILSPHEIDHNIRMLHSCLNIPKLETVSDILSKNLYMLFSLSLACSKMETKHKLFDIVVKALEIINKDELPLVMEMFLFGQKAAINVSIEEYEAGLAIKSSSAHMDHPKNKAAVEFAEMFNVINNHELMCNLLEICLQIFIDVKIKRTRGKSQMADLETELNALNINDENYTNMLNLLSEICSSEKVVNALKKNPVLVINFVEKILVNNVHESNDECLTIVLVLLNMVLANINKSKDLENKLHNLVPVLKKLSHDETNVINNLCKESITLITSKYDRKIDTPYQKAVSNIYDDLLPVQAHGIIEITKLIDANDPETISKRHFLFCLLQEHLKDSDSYLYLSAINGIASLATHCTSDVLSVLCGEYIEIHKRNDLETQNNRNKRTELRMKIGDIIVKVTRRLGEMAVLYKTVLLNTILCGCREDDPLLRASALSNLAEIALVLHFKMGSIICEVLHCVWSIIESDKAIECRRAAVMVISSLFKGLGKDALLELKDSLLPIYRTLNKLYKDQNEDNVVRLHAQLALEELNDIVRHSLFPQLSTDKEFLMFDRSDDIKYK